ALCSSFLHPSILRFLLVNRPPPTEIYTLSLHDALPILVQLPQSASIRFVENPDRDIFERFPECLGQVQILPSEIRCMDDEAVIIDGPRYCNRDLNNLLCCDFQSSGSVNVGSLQSV